MKKKTTNKSASSSSSSSSGSSIHQLVDVVKWDSTTKASIANMFISWEKQFEKLKSNFQHELKNGFKNEIKNEFEGIDELKRVKVAIGIRCGVFSDDSFMFASAMKSLRSILETLPNLVQNDVEVDVEKNDVQVDAGSLLRNSILDCFETAWTQKTRPWAKSEIEHTFNLAAERRGRFRVGGERQRLDNLTQRMIDGQRKTIVNRAVRANNSTAHPLRNKGFDAVR